MLRAASGIRDGCYTVVAGMCTCADYAARVLLAAPPPPTAQASSAPGGAGAGTQEPGKQGVLPGWRRWVRALRWVVMLA